MGAWSCVPAGRHVGEVLAGAVVVDDRDGIDVTAPVDVEVVTGPPAEWTPAAITALAQILDRTRPPAANETRGKRAA